MNVNTDIHRILILGHTGFIGRHLKATLEERLPGLPIIGQSMNDLDLTRKDLAPKLAALIDSSTVVVICAALKKQFGDNLGAFEHNLKVVVNLCEFFQTHPVGRIVYFSSAAVYGEDVHNLAITEDTPAQPRTYYGLAKYTSECLLEKVAEIGKCGSLLVLRPPLIYGPGDTSESYGPVGFIFKALRQDPIVLWGDGREKRCFVYVEDITSIVSRLVLGSSTGYVNAANCESHSFADILDLIRQALPSNFEVTTKDRTKAKVDNVFDNTKLMTMIGSFSFTPLSIGIQKTIDSIIKTTGGSK